METDTSRNLVRTYAVIAFIAALLLAISGLTLLFAGSTSTLMNVFTPTTSAGTAGTYALGITATVFAVIMLIMAIAYLFVGIGLWTFRPWARVWGIVMSILSLFAFPIGTIFGIFGLWLFGFSDAKELFAGRTVTARTTAAAGRRGP